MARINSWYGCLSERVDLTIGKARRRDSWPIDLSRYKENERVVQSGSAQQDL